MTFQEARELLLAGEYVCRAAWKLEDGYLAFMDGMKHHWKIITGVTPNAGNYIYSDEDFGAQDWEKFDFSKKSEALKTPAVA